METETAETVGYITIDGYECEVIDRLSGSGPRNVGDRPRQWYVTRCGNRVATANVSVHQTRSDAGRPCPVCRMLAADAGALLPANTIAQRVENFQHRAVEVGRLKTADAQARARAEVVRLAADALESNLAVPSRPEDWATGQTGGLAWLRAPLDGIYPIAYKNGGSPSWSKLTVLADPCGYCGQRFPLRYEVTSIASLLEAMERRATEPHDCDERRAAVAAERETGEAPTPQAPQRVMTDAEAGLLDSLRLWLDAEGYGRQE